MLIEILEIAEAAAEEEVLANIAIWPFDLALNRHGVHRLAVEPNLPGNRRYADTPVQFKDHCDLTKSDQ